MKITIVTPSFNQGRFISQTIESIWSQAGDFFIEHIIMDGGSTDGTIEILKKYESALDSYPVKCKGLTFKWVSGKDNGMYDAINKGFAMATGDVYAWLNSDDMYYPRALAHVSEIFSKFSDIDWISGITLTADEDGNVIQKMSHLLLYNTRLIRDGFYKNDTYFISQEGTFWRAGLWKKVGGIDASLKLAGDFYLWTRFAEHTSIYMVNALFAKWRRHGAQLSRDMAAYSKECERFSQFDLKTRLVKWHFGLWKKLPFIYRLHKYLFRLDYNLIVPGRGEYELRRLKTFAA